MRNDLLILQNYNMIFYKYHKCLYLHFITFNERHFINITPRGY